MCWGNHELSAYSTRQECYEQYMKLSAKHGIHLLINDGFMKYDYIDKRSVRSVLYLEELVSPNIMKCITLRTCAIRRI